jgi:glycosyltransferase involved in cell wall biosynthesis
MNVAEIHVVFILYVWPEPDSSAAGSRTLGLINACLSENWNVSLISAAEKSDYSYQFKQHNNKFLKCYQTKLNDCIFDELIKSMEIDIVIYDRFIMEEQFSWRLEQFHPQALKVLDTSDLHFVRRAREKSVKKNQAVNYYSSDCYREIAAIYRSDTSLIISPVELQILTDEFQVDTNLLHYLPFMLEKITFSKSSFEQRKNFIMIGNFLHKPNYDAVLWCIKDIWPKIFSLLPSAQLHVYGAYMPEHMHQWHAPKKGILIKGRANNLNSLFQDYLINLVPLRFGAGIKGKIADGFCAGTPCITTNIGAEGMCQPSNFGGLIKDDADDIAESSVKLYQNQDDWYQLQNRGYQCINDRHQKNNRQQQFILHLKKLLANLEKHRQRNFIGSMLKHHFHQSSHYMSKWIEEKNRACKNL